MGTAQRGEFLAHFISLFHFNSNNISIIQNEVFRKPSTNTKWIFKKLLTNPQVVL